MASVRLLVHIAGEADLLLSSQERDKTVRAERVAKRCRDLATAQAGPDGPARLRQMLLAPGAWGNEPFSTPAPSPLLGTLEALGDTADARDLAVMVLGTRQEPSDPLDTWPIAQAIAEVVRVVAAAADSSVVRSAEAVLLPGMTERDVATTLRSHLGPDRPYRQALVTWGSGSTALILGVLTALSRAGLPWQLVVTNEAPSAPRTYEVVDPLARLDTDPVSAVFVRWRMFAALETLTREDPPLVHLTDAQHDLVRQAAQRHRDGLEARDCQSLRALLADAVVRRDGSASLTVRRYITRRYEELLAIDRASHPGAQDLLRRADEQIRLENQQRRRGGRRRSRTLGGLLAWIRDNRDSDPVVKASTGLPSYEWLFTPEVEALQNIGRGSHNLLPPDTRDAKVVGDHLSRHEIDGPGWRQAGLPEPPVAPADTVLAVWLAGARHRTRDVGSIGRQLVTGLPSVVLRHLGVQETRIRAVIFAVDDGQGSLDQANAEAALINGVSRLSTGEPRGEAWVEPITLAGFDHTTVERAVEARLTRRTGALLLVPTGFKPVLLPLLHALRRVGARHGLPLFVRELADPEGSGPHGVHQWPALTGGDVPLLDAAKRALYALELDVAWRLLAASAIEDEVVEKARRLADAFASRGSVPDVSSARGDDRAEWTTNLLVQRLEMVHAALAHATTTADRIRLLVLAADVVNASIEAAAPGRSTGAAYRGFRKGLERELSRNNGTNGVGTPQAVAARILLLLNAARDQAPITHGTGTDPDAVVADRADDLARAWNLSPAEAGSLPRNVAALLRDAVVAAAERGHGRRDQADSLLREHGRIIADIDRAIHQRGFRSKPNGRD